MKNEGEDYNTQAEKQLAANKGNVSVEDAAKTGLVEGSVSNKNLDFEKKQG
jgi:hypothetical protein